MQDETFRATLYGDRYGYSYEGSGGERRAECQRAGEIERRFTAQESRRIETVPGNPSPVNKEASEPAIPQRMRRGRRSVRVLRGVGCVRRVGEIRMAFQGMRIRVAA